VSGGLLLFGIVLPWLIVALVAVLGAWIGFQLIQQNGRLLTRLEALEHRLAQLQMAPAPGAAPALSQPFGLPIGSPAPAFELPDLMGERKSLGDFRGRKVLAIFFNPRCGFCTRMVPDLATLPVDGKDGKPIPVVISAGDAQENRKLAAEHGVQCPVLLQDGMEVASQYQCHGTPMGYLIDEEGRIASAPAVGADALLALRDGATAAIPASGHGDVALGGMRSLAESKIQRNGLPPGTPAPSFTLPRLQGGELSLEEFRGKKVLLVFSDPKCGPCMALSPQLEQAHRRSGDVQVLMVSRGEVEANREKVEEYGLTFPVLLQKQWEISREYAMFATPVGYLIDEHGVIATDVATGTDAVRALLTRAIAGQRERCCKCGKSLSECGKGDCDCKRQKAKATTAGRNGQ
jgi:peroxiredoxin